MAQFEVNNISVESILTEIKSKEIAIPEIQRPFVWDSSKVRDLIDSLYKGYPIGYIIIWKNPDVRLKDGSTSLGKKILIDGQQRITALSAAIVGQPVIGSDYKKKRIKIAFNPLSESFEVANSAIEKDPTWIADISVLFNADFDMFSYVFEYGSKNGLIVNERLSSISKVLTKLLAIKNSNLGIIELAHTLDIETVTEIFIRINSKGVALSQADFAMSKISSNETYEGNVIRKTIDYFCHLMNSAGDYEAIKENDTEFAITPYFAAIRWAASETEDIYIPDYADLLRVAFTSKFYRGPISDLVNLLSGRDFETREYKEEIAESAFKMLKEGVLAFVNQTNFQRYLMIIKSTGIINASLVRSQNVLNFGYVLYLILRDRNMAPSKIEHIVRRWLVLSILTGRYSSSPESKFDYDVKRFKEAEDPMEYIRHIEEGELSDAFWNNILVSKLDTSVDSSPYFKVFLMAQIKAGDKGFLSEHIEVKSLIEQRGDIHHIFPKKYLQKNGLNNKSIYNKIANYVYTQSEVNIQIKDKAPNLYMKEVLIQCETGQAKYGGIIEKKKVLQNMENNCIPKDIFEMDVKDYGAFLESRRKLMAKKIRKYYQELQ